MDVASYITKESSINIQFHYFLVVALRLRKRGGKVKVVGERTKV
jgi:hypothetical protein